MKPTIIPFSKALIRLDISLRENVAARWGGDCHLESWKMNISQSGLGNVHKVVVHACVEKNTWGKLWEIYGVSMESYGEIYGKFMGNHRKSMESHGNYGKIHAKSIRNLSESYGKSIQHLMDPQHHHLWNQQSMGNLQLANGGKPVLKLGRFSKDSTGTTWTMHHFDRTSTNVAWFRNAIAWFVLFYMSGGLEIFAKKNWCKN